MDEVTVGRKLLMVEELPEGPYSRYLRGIWPHQDGQPFEEWKAEYIAEKKREEDEFNKEFPVEVDQTIKFEKGQSFRMVKRKGKDWNYTVVTRFSNWDKITMNKNGDEDWSCYHNNGQPSGGYGGNVSLDEALSLMNK